MKGYTFDGMDFFNCYAGFEHVYEEVIRNIRPVLSKSSPNDSAAIRFLIRLYIAPKRALKDA